MTAAVGDTISTPPPALLITDHVPVPDPSSVVLPPTNVIHSSDLSSPAVGCSATVIAITLLVSAHMGAVVVLYILLYWYIPSVSMPAAKSCSAPTGVAATHPVPFTFTSHW